MASHSMLPARLNTPSKHRPRKSKAGGARKRPVRYTETLACSEALTIALRFHRKGALAQAAEQYALVTQTEPQSVDAWMNLGAIAVLFGQGLVAQNAIETALNLLPTNARLQRDAAIAFATLGANHRARECYMRAVQIEPTLVGAWLGLARLCHEMGDPIAAQSYAQKAISLAIDDPSAWIELHRAGFSLPISTISMDAALRAQQLAPTDAWAVILAAGALALDGQRSVADALLTKIDDSERSMVDALRYALEQRVENTKIFAAKSETLRYSLQCAKLPGPVLEFGVRYAVSTRVLAEDPTVSVLGFDSFQGLPEAWVGRTVGAFSTKGAVPVVPSNVRLVEGWFEQTVPHYAERECTEPPRLLHIDSDLYASAQTVLRAMAPWIRPGCVLVFDEYLGNRSWRDDEHRAFTEALELYRWKVVPIVLSWITGQAAFLVIETAACAVH